MNDSDLSKTGLVPSRGISRRGMIQKCLMNTCMQIFFGSQVMIGPIDRKCYQQW
ncbi:hypothetical protein TorRG33x02_305690, partial [Trema orientale]